MCVTRSTPAARRSVEVSVEHAAARAELELQARAFAHLERGIAEMAEQLGRGEAEKPGHHARRAGGGGRLGDRLLGRGRTTGDEQGESGDDAAHGSTMHAASIARQGCGRLERAADGAARRCNR